MQLVSQDIREQVVQVFENLKAVAMASGATLADATKLTVYLTDLAHFPIVNEVMAQYFVTPYPARATVQVSALPRGALVEVDAILAR
jgi:reactive intermediate/imine deaminase